MTFETKQGCKVKFEVVGNGVGITIIQKDGKSALYACDKDDAKLIAEMMKEISK